MSTDQLTLTLVYAAWKDEFGNEWPSVGKDYAYGVIDYRLGGRKGLPQPGHYISGREGSHPAADKANRRQIRAQVDATIERLRGGGS